MSQFPRAKRARFEEFDENEINNKQFGEPPELGDAVYLWYNQMKNQKIPINKDEIRSRALILNEKLFGPSQFNTQIWIEQWKNRYNVDLSTFESTPGDSQLVTECNDIIMKYVEEKNLSHDQIFHCNITTLNFLSLPVKSLIYQMERDLPEFQRNNDRVTILVCANASGSLKIPLMVIGQFPSPRSAKGEILTSLPVYYKYRKYSLLDSYLFQEWFDDVFVPKVEDFLRLKGLPGRAILTIDNQYPHPDIEKLQHSEIVTMFLPRDVNPIIQPVTQEAVDNLKKFYREEFVSNIIDCLKDDCRLMDYLKVINIKNVIYWLSEAWHKISVTNNSWSTVWLDDESNSGKLENNVVQLVRILRTFDSILLINNEDVMNWIRNDQIAQVFLTDEEIIRSIQEEENGDYIDIKPNLEALDVTANDARQAAARLINFFQDQNISREELLTLHQLRDKAALIMREDENSQEVDDGKRAFFKNCIYFSFKRNFL